MLAAGMNAPEDVMCGGAVGGVVAGLFGVKVYIMSRFSTTNMLNKIKLLNFL